MMRLTIFLVCVTTGSGFRFTGSASEIHPRLTHTLTLTCDLQGSLPDPEHMVKHEGDDKTQKVAHITSVAISRDDKDIAMVTKFDNATIFSSGTAFTISGTVNGSVGEDSQLTVSWQYPAHTEAGVYRCEVSGVTDHGHCVTFSQNLTLTFKANPNVDDLVDHIYSQQTTIKEMHGVIEAMERKMAALEIKFGHLENGSVVFTSPASWNSQGSQRVKDSVVRFARGYGRAPQVHVGVSGLTQSSRNRHQAYEVEVVSVSDDGFLLRCSTREDSRYHFDTLTVEWTSFPQ